MTATKATLEIDMGIGIAWEGTGMTRGTVHRPAEAARPGKWREGTTTMGRHPRAALPLPLRLVLCTMTEKGRIRMTWSGTAAPHPRTALAQALATIGTTVVMRGSTMAPRRLAGVRCRRMGSTTRGMMVLPDLPGTCAIPGDLVGHMGST